jgi:histidine ammonia-lyase
MEAFEIHPRALDLAALRLLDDPARPVALSSQARDAIARAHAVLETALAEGRRIYGVTTGPGPLADQAIDPAQLAEAQRRLVLSNATGVGAALSPRITRRIMILKLATFAAGASGVTEALTDRIVTLINADCLPVIPAKGSVGASGDLAPLAHLGACLLGEGDAVLREERMSAREALSELGLDPFPLGPKEGLALVNGTQVSTALAVDGLFQAEECLSAALTCGALSLEAGSGTVSAFDSRIHDLRGQPGQVAVAAALRGYLDGSALQNDRPIKRLQDPYCLRCMPQVMGAALDQIEAAAATLDCELRAVTDNPLIDPETGDVLFGGNFHAQGVGMAADTIALAMSEIGAISERRTAFLVDENMSGLPAFLVAGAGLDSGFMVAQVTAAALVSENRHLAAAASTDSIPTAANQEDYVSMATYAARRLGDMAENLRAILAIELLAACQGLDLRRPARSSPVLERVHTTVRERVAPWHEDRFFAPDLEAACQLLVAGTAVAPVPASLLPSRRRAAVTRHASAPQI